MTTRRKLAWVSLLYFAEGFPFGLVVDNLPVYFRVHGASLVDVGLLSLVGLPWSVKFLWAPLVDKLGHPERWIAAALTVVAAATALVPAFDPSAPGVGLWAVLFALSVASATQDIAIDAYTIGLLAPGEEGIANGVRVSAYRAALIVAGGGSVAIAGALGWPAVYWICAVLLLGLAIGVLALPQSASAAAAGESWLEGFRAWLGRPGVVALFVFVLTYKLGDSSMGPMVKPFWVDRGLSVAEIGTVSTTAGVALSVLGALVGGALTSRIGIFHGLWLLGLAQAFSNLGYAAAAAFEAGRPGIYAASAFESFTGGLGTAAFLAFLMRCCDRERAATQYALLSALFGMTRTIAGAASGLGAREWGYAAYFALTFLLSFPAFALLPWIRPWTAPRAAQDAQSPDAR